MEVNHQEYLMLMFQILLKMNSLLTQIHKETAMKNLTMQFFLQLDTTQDSSIKILKVFMLNKMNQALFKNKKISTNFTSFKMI